MSLRNAAYSLLIATVEFVILCQKYLGSNSGSSLWPFLKLESATYLSVLGMGLDGSLG